mmetsp:Transcript_94161/g.248839  ORF Transcript_94161/g.248839 Transcript_94161/m.248839 type:complete len:247 (-) Transcript_94161:227-967(-)
MGLYRASAKHVTPHALHRHRINKPQQDGRVVIPTIYLAAAAATSILASTVHAVRIRIVDVVEARIVQRVFDFLSLLLVGLCLRRLCRLCRLLRRFRRIRLLLRRFLRLGLIRRLLRRLRRRLAGGGGGDLVFFFPRKPTSSLFWPRARTSSPCCLFHRPPPRPPGHLPDLRGSLSSRRGAHTPQSSFARTLHRMVFGRTRSSRWRRPSLRGGPRKPACGRSTPPNAEVGSLPRSELRGWPWPPAKL